MLSEENDREGCQLHHPPGCRGCPLDKIGRGWVAGCGDPTKAKYAVVLEAPGRDEIAFRLAPNPNRAFLTTQAECDKELAIRRRDYPDVPEEFLRLGIPVVGQTGGAMMWWVWPKVGIRREEVFLDNTLRCLPPKGKSGAAYPTGEVKKAAEHHCRQYDRFHLYRPDTVIFSIHPASLLREITPLPLVVKDFEKVRDFTVQGRKVIMLLGGKATGAFMRYGSNVTRWRGHYAALAANWWESYKELFSFRKKERKKRLTKSAREAEDVFGVPATVLQKAQKKQERPAELLPGLCKSAKRHTHKRPPKCGYADCWQNYERKRDALP